jgi:exosortase/archaeosortase family protein
MAVLAVPLAILANAVRVAASAAVPTLAEGTPHEVIGLVIFVLCLGALMLCAKWFNSPPKGAAHA